MAEKKTTQKDVKTQSSVNEESAEKSTKSTAKKTADKGEVKTSASAKKQEKTATKTASEITENKNEKTASKTNSKSAAEKPAKKTAEKSTEKATSKSSTAESVGKTTADKESAKNLADTPVADKVAKKKSTTATSSKAAVAEKSAPQKEAVIEDNKAESETLETKSKSTKRKPAASKQEDIANDAKIDTAAAVYGTSMSSKTGTSKKAETSTTKSPKMVADAEHNDSIDKTSKADKKKKNDKNDTKIDIKSFTRDTALTIKGFFTDKKTRIYAFATVAILLLFILILSISVGVVSNSSGLSANSRLDSIKDNSVSKGSKYDYEYRTTAVVGYTEEYLEYNEDRKIPQETKNEGIVTNPNMYPKYGSTPKGITESDRRELINEAWQITSINTRIGSDGYPKNTYDRMDKDGNLYLGNYQTNGKPSKLYKHTSAVGMYFGDVDDDEQPISKRMTFNPRSYHSHGMYNVTGIYAPAGEVIKVEISKADMESTGGIVIHIGQALYNSKANNIWLAKGQMQRFPVILNTMYVTKDTAAEYDEKTETYTAYVGSFLGGPVYVGNEAKTFTTTISGGVRYSHFILGHTTPEDFEANKDSSAPYFDLEVWDNGVLHSGPKYYAQNFSYNDLFKVAELWDKVTAVTTTGNNQNIVFLYDPFVAAGAAVAFPRQHAVNCPGGWMSSSLNYEALIKGGSWGNFHEYHHNFQGYGVGNGGEVTNNALTLVSYALFTKISSNRRIESIGAAGLGGWNSYTSATYALDQVKAIASTNRSPSNGNQGLALYAALLHNFGADAFIQVRKLGGGQSYANYFKKWEEHTHNNMTFYFKEMLRANEFGGLNDDWYEANSNKDYPTFVPISSVYQTGRSWTYDDETKYFKTMQPYVIPYGEKFTIDLSEYKEEGGMYKSGSIVLPEGFSYKILNISQPKNGSIVKESDYIYTYTPSSDLLSGDIYVTLQVTHNEGKYKVDNIDLILGFEQSHELSGRMLERTTYEFEGEVTYTSSTDAFTNGYKGATNVITGDNKNTTQNSNTDIWLTPDERAAIADKNVIFEVKGKYYLEELATYRFMLRGRGDVALYISFDGQNYKQAAHYTTGNSPNFPTGPLDEDKNPTNKDSYIDLKVGLDADSDVKPGSWMYFKMILVVNSHKNSFMGLGMGKVPEPMPQVDEDGNPLLDKDDRPLPPIKEPTPISYANGYRQSYQFPENIFSTDYFYTKEYKQTYRSEEKLSTEKQTVISTNYQPFNNSFPIENICDGDLKTNVNSIKTKVSKENPFVVEIKLANAITANKFRIHYSRNGNAAFIGSRPKNYKLEIKLKESDEYIPVADVKDAACADYMHTYTFDKFYDFQYYKLTVTDTYYLDEKSDRFIVIHELEFISQIEINYSRTGVGDKKVKLYGNWDIKNTQSKFGRTYVGKANSTMEFEFTGKRLILFSTTAFQTNFEVYIDGKKVNSIDIDESSAVCKESYISQELKNKTHTVTIKCLGEANIESISIEK